MNRVYNNQFDFASEMKDFLLKCNPNIRKTQLKFIPFISFGMILSESSVASDIAKTLKDDFSLVQHDSVIRRIKRLFKNKLFDPYKSMTLLFAMSFLTINQNMMIEEFT